MKTKSNNKFLHFTLMVLLYSSCSVMAAWSDTHEVFKNGVPGCDYIASATTIGDPGRGGCVSAAVTGLNGSGRQNGESVCNPLLFGSSGEISHYSSTAIKRWENGDITGTNYVHTFGKWIDPTPEIRQGTITKITQCYCSPE